MLWYANFLLSHCLQDEVPSRGNFIKFYNGGKKIHQQVSGEHVQFVLYNPCFRQLQSGGN